MSLTDLPSGHSLDGRRIASGGRLGPSDDRDYLSISGSGAGWPRGLAEEPWSVIRRKLRFVGVTSRAKTSPNTYRWHQQAAWTRQLPARAVTNVSLHPFVWSYFGDHQTKLTRSFRPEHWLAEVQGPGRDERTRHALAEAAALVTYGLSPRGRHALAHAIGREPTLAQSWLRSFVTALNAG